ncbi:MAG: hypothetical protein KKF48_00260 [Nanoarchaeota archaeon]|nr:hypothetical protein [Nanoarchaeota archaeon]MBU1027457.1 hypothetical protein [Nanoarchaeota archaeon]
MANNISKVKLTQLVKDGVTIINNVGIKKIDLGKRHYNEEGSYCGVGCGLIDGLIIKYNSKGFKDSSEDSEDNLPLFSISRGPYKKLGIYSKSIPEKTKEVAGFHIFYSPGDWEKQLKNSKAKSVAWSKFGKEILSKL